MDCHIHRAEPLLLEPVHVGGEGVASLLTRLDERSEQRVAHRATRDMQGAVAAAVVVAAAGAGLRALEVGQHVRIGPARQSVAGPAVVIERVAADVDHGIERRRPSEHASARPIHAPAVHVGLRLGLVGPVIFGVAEIVGERGRHLDLPGAVLGPGLQQEHARASLRKSVRQHAAGRPRADDHIVV